jgi:hypothetical protein
MPASGPAQTLLGSGQNTTQHRHGLQICYFSFTFFTNIVQLDEAELVVIRRRPSESLTWSQALHITSTQQLLARRLKVRTNVVFRGRDQIVGVWMFACFVNSAVRASSLDQVTIEHARHAYST